MKKYLMILVAMLCFGISANAQSDEVVVGNEINDELLVYNTNERLNADCNVRVYTSGNDIRYTNECDDIIRVKVFYIYRTCSNVAENGKMVKACSKWSEKKYMYHNLSARTSNSTVVSGNNSLEYQMVNWDIAN